ncbi:MAG: dual specificity protein phosphatase [Desulfobacteraceae bacterium]
MSDYDLRWITKNMGIGPAPMSYAQLDAIGEQGIDAIVNLCGEFSDLHELEASAGFEVYYLPIWDEDVPPLETMEKALAWLDEALYLEKKVLIHCRHGIGRTGTFVTAYMIRRGLGLKAASKQLKQTRAVPSSYGQWKLVKRYNKRSGVLKIREPSLESRARVDLGTFFSDYDTLVVKIDQQAGARGEKGCPSQVRGEHLCCAKPFDIPFIEVIYLHWMTGRKLTSAQREAAIQRAVDRSNAPGVPCPFNQGNGCEIFEIRPVRCRIYGMKNFREDREAIEKNLLELSREVFLAFSGHFLADNAFRFSLADTISGRFVQAYFNHMAAGNTP